jgi:hypothetical protein
MTEDNLYKRKSFEKPKIENNFDSQNINTISLSKSREFVNKDNWFKDKDSNNYIQHQNKGVNKNLII